MFGIGPTLMVNVCGTPTQLYCVVVVEGVTVIFAVISAFVLFDAVKDGMPVLESPVPNPKPTVELSFDHVYTIPCVGDVKVTAVVALPGQTT
jgi:hypothetical protein